MNKLRFAQACKKAAIKKQETSGIGTLGERSIHAALKYYFEECDTRHEAKVGSFVADIVGENGVIEIQTRGFYRLRKKLTELLEIVPVTIVHPVAKTRWISTVDKNSGEIVSKRKFPRKGTIYSTLLELYTIKPLLTHENLRVCIVLMEVNEYRYLNVKKKRNESYDKIPIDLIDEIYLENVEDYAIMLPDSLPCPFNTKDFAKCAKISLSGAQTSLNVLNHVGVVSRVGKVGNTYLYEKCIIE